MARSRGRVKLTDAALGITPIAVVRSGYAFRTKLDDDLLANICLLLEEGLPITTTCEYLGITQNTHYRWLTNGRHFIAAIEDEDEKLSPKPEWEVYAIYLIEVKKSIAKYLREKIENVNGNFTPSWVRDITILERRDYQNWGRNVTVVERDEAKNPDESFL